MPNRTRLKLINPFIPSGLLYFNSLGICFVNISELNANSADPDQTPRSAASDLSLHCLQMSLSWNARL